MSAEAPEAFVECGRTVPDGGDGSEHQAAREILEFETANAGAEYRVEGKIIR